MNRTPFTGDLKELEALEVKGVVRRVRTPAGVRRFKQPIGSIIVRDSILSNLKIKDPIYDGWDLVVGKNGKKYDVGLDDEDGKWRAFGTNDWDDIVAEGDDEESVYRALNDAVQKDMDSRKAKRVKRTDNKPKAPKSPEPSGSSSGKVKPEDLNPGDYVEGDGIRGRVINVEGNRVITDGGTIRGPVSRIATADSLAPRRQAVPRRQPVPPGRKTAYGEVFRNSPKQPEDLTTEQRERLKLARAGAVVVLDKKPDGTFDVHGDHVMTCSECGQIMIGKAGVLNSLMSRHRVYDHGLRDGGLLGNGSASTASTTRRVAKTAKRVKRESDNVPVKDLNPGDPDTFVVAVREGDRDQFLLLRELIRNAVGEDIGNGFSKPDANATYFVLPSRLTSALAKLTIHRNIHPLLNTPRGLVRKEKKDAESKAGAYAVSDSGPVRRRRRTTKPKAYVPPKTPRTPKRPRTTAPSGARRTANTSGGVSKRYIRTEAGARRYGGSVGDLIGKAKIKKGQTLSELAKEYYGDARKWKLIAKASGIKDPRKIPVGKELVFPPDPSKKGRGKSGTTGRSTSKRGRSSSRQSSDPRRRKIEEYKAKIAKIEEEIAESRKKRGKTGKYKVNSQSTYYPLKGESLTEIVKRFYGDAAMLGEVRRINGISGGKIPAGRALILPDLDPKEIYSPSERAEAEEKQEEQTKKAAPLRSHRGGRRRDAKNGYVYYTDGSIWHAKHGWVYKPSKTPSK